MTSQTLPIHLSIVHIKNLCDFTKRKLGVLKQDCFFDWNFPGATLVKLGDLIEAVWVRISGPDGTNLLSAWPPSTTTYHSHIRQRLTLLGLLRLLHPWPTILIVGCPCESKYSSVTLLFARPCWGVPCAHCQGNTSGNVCYTIFNKCHKYCFFFHNSLLK